jgi:hypothetical protein
VGCGLPVAACGCKTVPALSHEDHSLHVSEPTSPVWRHASHKHKRTTSGNGFCVDLPAQAYRNCQTSHARRPC